jgi:hypothetical protein
MQARLGKWFPGYYSVCILSVLPATVATPSPSASSLPTRSVGPLTSVQCHHSPPDASTTDYSADHDQDNNSSRQPHSGDFHPLAHPQALWLLWPLSLSAGHPLPPLLPMPLISPNAPAQPTEAVSTAAPRLDSSTARLSSPDSGALTEACSPRCAPSLANRTSIRPAPVASGMAAADVCSLCSLCSARAGIARQWPLRVLKMYQGWRRAAHRTSCTPVLPWCGRGARSRRRRN